MNKPVANYLVEVMEWLEPMSRIDKYEIAGRIAIAGLEGYSGTLTAEQQRRFFGRYIFGKMTLNISTYGNGRVHGSRTVCFGTDFETFDFNFEEIANIANSPHSFSIAGRITNRK